MLGMANNGGHLSELLDCVANLLVQDAAVGDYNYRAEDIFACLLQPHELMSEPRNRIALSASGRMLDEISAADSGLLRIHQKLPHYIQLVITRKDLRLLFPSVARIFLFDDFGVVFQYVRQALAGQYFAPQVIRFETVWIGWISRAIIPSLVEGQEPRKLPFQM